MRANIIRPLVLGIFKNNGAILVAEGLDSAKNETFYRPLGGGIEFGETSKDALKREMREELGTEITNLKYITTAENIFVYNNQPGHEFVVIYEAEFVDPSLYKPGEIEVREGENKLKALWIPLDKFKNRELILYPEKLVGYL